MTPTLTIGQLAAQADVGVETVRFYQRKRLVPQPPRPPGGVRRYGDVEVQRIRFIRAAQELGFSLADIAKLLDLEDGAACDDVQHLAQEKLQVVHQRLANLRRMENTLSALIGQCKAADGHVKCPIIATLAGSAGTKRSGSS